MSNAALIRGGFGGLLAAALFVTSTLINRISPIQDPYVTTTDYVNQAVLMLAFAGAVAAIVGLAVLLRRSGRFRRLTVVGAALAGVGYFGVSVLSLANLVQGERVLNGVRQIAALSLLAGSALLGVVVLITRVIPWWCGVLLIVAFPLGDVVDALFAGGEGILLALLLGSVGAALLTRADASQPSPHSAPQARSTIP
jgi:hypothetical protein